MSQIRCPKRPPPAFATPPEPQRGLTDAVLDALRCPQTGQAVFRDDAELVTQDAGHRYAVTEAGVPLFAPDPQRPESRIQQAHYDRIAGMYASNLSLPHTQEYMNYLDDLLLEALGPGSLGFVAEICCGRGH